MKNLFRVFFSIGTLTVFIILLLPGCRILRGISDPAVRLYKRGSCISVDVPPITLTPSQTALERQLIGEDAAIEENGWLVASAKSSRGAASKTEDLEEARDLYREIGVLEYLAEEIQKYKLAGIIGESHDGNLYMLPKQHLENTGIAAEPDELRKASGIIREVNRSRQAILQYHFKRDSLKDVRGSKATDEKYKHIYYNQVKPGEWRQLKDGRWEKVR